MKIASRLLAATLATTLPAVIASACGASSADVDDNADGQLVPDANRVDAPEPIADDASSGDARPDRAKEASTTNDDSSTTTDAVATADAVADVAALADAGVGTLDG